MINNVTLLGRLTAAPELKTTQSGISVVAFTVAIARRYQPKDGEKQTDFINCVAWRNTAEFICKYFNKGDFIAVTGEIQTRKYEDKDGNKRVATEVVLNNVSFGGGKSQRDDSNDSKQEQEQRDKFIDDFPNGFIPCAYGEAADDDLPF